MAGGLAVIVEFRSTVWPRALEIVVAGWRALTFAAAVARAGFSLEFCAGLRHDSRGADEGKGEDEDVSEEHFYRRC